MEDLGAMDAARLWESIPEEDGAGRGRNDLADIEKELSVKICFCDDAHVLLVGAKAKLQKKAFVLRNLLRAGPARRKPDCSERDSLG